MRPGMAISQHNRSDGEHDVAARIVRSGFVNEAFSPRVRMKRSSGAASRSQGRQISAALDWATGFGQIIRFGIEGTGSYGSGLTSFICRSGHRIVEVHRPDRRMRLLVGKSDTLDAENASRAVLAGFAIVDSKTADGTVEIIRQLKVAHDGAVQNRAAAIITLKAMLIHASDQLR
jgi:hypothetical protein